MTLSDDELERYARHIILREIGGTGQARLKAARVLIVGAGGIGAPVLQYLAAAGVGTLVVVDPDVVSLSNLQRQLLYDTADTGRNKVTAAADRLRALNPHVTIDPHARAFDREAFGLLDAVDVVVDGTDNFATRLLVADATQERRVPLVSAAVGSFEGQLAVFRGWEPDKPCYRCLVGDDPERGETSCADQGVLGALTGVLGSLAALETIRQIVPFGDDTAGRLLIADLLSLRFRTLTLPKDPGCSACAA